MYIACVVFDVVVVLVSIVVVVTVDVEIGAVSFLFEVVDYHVYWFLPPPERTKFVTSGETFWWYCCTETVNRATTRD